MRLLLLAALSLTAISCATLSSGTTELISVTSSPSGAHASLACAKESQTAVTPAKLTIRRNAGDCQLTVSKEGYVSRTVTIEQGVNPRYWADMIFAPVVPAGAYVTWLGNDGEKPACLLLLAAGGAIFGTDFATGAVHTHRPGSVDIVLAPSP